MHSAVLGPAAGALLVGALGCAPQSTRTSSAQPVDPALPVAPATHAGTLPCADCPGIEWTLTVLDDGTYRLRRVYLDAKDGRDLAFIDIGRWDTGGADDRLVLRNLDDGPINLEARRDGALRLLDRRGQPIQSAFAYGLERLPRVDRIDDVFAMRGEFSYLADAGRFTDCRTEKPLPVAQEADNAALERAYLAAAQEPGAPVLVTFDGRFVLRPPVEGDGLQEVVLVERFGEALPWQRCEGAVDPPELAGTYWELTELPREVGFSVDPDLRAHLMLDAEAGRVSGSSGCNRLTGTYTVNGDGLTFGPLASTRMACAPPAMELERRFQVALRAVERYSIDGEVLTLIGPEGAVARFVRYLE